uniref:Uncharacterized protein n=1 Tax=Monodelphis domestica TaxID=13616 RepID=A0A5F8GCB4_MONDO
MVDRFSSTEKYSNQRLVLLPMSHIWVIMKSSPEMSSINQKALALTAKAIYFQRRF